MSEILMLVCMLKKFVTFPVLRIYLDAVPSQSRRAGDLMTADCMQLFGQRMMSIIIAFLLQESNELFLNPLNCCICFYYFL